MRNSSKRTIRRTSSILLIMAFVLASIFGNTVAVFAAEQSDVKITNLRVEYMTNPIGIDAAQPRFSWVMESDTRGQKQTAYRVLVSSRSGGGGDVWDSGKVISDKSVAVKYEGDPLQPSTRYYWKVIVWDKDGNSVTSEEEYFETGLMSTDGETNWDGAKWIAMKQFDTYAVEAKITLSSVAEDVYSSVTENVYSSLVFSARDSGNYYYWRFEQTAEGYLAFQPRVLMGSRNDYPLVDGDYDPQVGAPPAVTTSVYAGDSTEFTVRVEYDTDANIIVTKINDDEVSTITNPKGFRPASGGWFPRPAAVVDVAPIADGMVGMLLTSNVSEHPEFSTSYDDIKVIRDGIEAFSDDFSGEKIFDNGDIIDGKLVLTLPSGSRSLLALQTNFVGFGAPMLRKETTLAAGKTVKSARLYISALGAYDAYINGKKVGIVNEDGSTTYELLNPGWTNYERNINYISYDVTSYITGNSVTLAAMLGNAWYNGGIAGSSKYVKPGNDVVLKAKLLITYTDNTTQTVVTGTSWKSTDKGPITYNDIYNGETYDARREIPGWNNNGFDDSGWYGVKEVSLIFTEPDATLTSKVGNTVHIVDSLDQTPISITTYDSIINVGDTEKVKSGLGEINIVSSKTYTDPEEARSAQLTLVPGETAIYDLGQNMVGVPKITFEGDEGTTIRLRFAEMVNDDSVPASGGRGADGPKGTIYVRNLRGARATDYYTLKGRAGGETYQPTFTFHGFRYIEVSIESGTETAIRNVTGKVATSAIEKIGNIETSDEYVNKLYLNQIWGQYGNYLSIPTDCPQRDERCGWTGDAQLFANTALYNMDSVRFLENFMDILVDSQISYGNGEFFQNVSPGARYTTGAAQSGWSDAGIVIPWTVWMMTGDDTIIESHYDAMVRYMDYIEDLNIEAGTQYRGPGSIYGDWLAFQGTSSKLMSDLYYAYDAKMMAQMAEQIGKTSDASKYEELFENIKNTIISNYISVGEDGKITVLSGKEPSTTLVGQTGKSEDNSQTALLWMLKLGIYSDEDQKQQMIELLVENIENSDEYKATHPDSERVNYAENTLAVGFLGVNVIAPVLSDVGHPDLSYKLLLQDQMPSWLYSVKNGATTIWERWNSYSIEDGFGPSGMNSYNHYSYGAIAEWMYRYMAGINFDAENPGFKHIILQPTIDPNNGITWANASYESVYGTIKSGWKVNNGIFTYSATVPANTTATLYIPTISENAVTESGEFASQAEGITFIGYENGKAVYKLESGSYEFTTIVTPNVSVPNAPATLSMERRGRTFITLSWSSVDNAAWYNVYRSSTENGTYSKVNTYPVSGLYYTDSGLSSGTKYYYKVTAANEIGESAYSGIVAVTTTKSSSGDSSGGGTTPTTPQVPTKPETPATPETQGKKFIDTANYPWAEDAIESLAAKGIIKGTSETTFEPGKNITRADFMLLLVRALGLEAEFDSNFSDVSQDAYYYEALGIAKALGIAAGVGDGSFNPKGEISRQDMMVLVVRALKAVGKIQETGTASDLSAFADASQVSEYAVSSVATLVKEGIIKGDGTNINPKGTATRAEAAVIIYRLLNR